MDSDPFSANATSQLSSDFKDAVSTSPLEQSLQITSHLQRGHSARPTDLAAWLHAPVWRGLAQCDSRLMTSEASDSNAIACPAQVLPSPQRLQPSAAAAPSCWTRPSWTRPSPSGWRSPPKRGARLCPHACGMCQATASHACMLTPWSGPMWHEDGNVILVARMLTAERIPWRMSSCQPWAAAN